MYYVISTRKYLSSFAEYLGIGWNLVLRGTGDILMRRSRKLREKLAGVHGGTRQSMEAIASVDAVDGLE